MIKLPKKTEYVRVRRYRLVPTPQMMARYCENLEKLSKIYDF